MSLSLYSSCDVGTGVYTAPVASKNWEPGNWIISPTTSNDSIWDVSGTTQNRGILQRLAADTAGKWKGAVLRFGWTDLEGDTLGDYTTGMNKVQSYLDQIASLPGRRLIIFIQVKTFGATNHAVPLYMRNSATYSDGKDYYTTRDATTNQGSYNGEYAYESANGGPGGFVPNMHVAAVRTRFEALMAEFASRFNTNPYLEAICFSEASISQPIGSSGAASETVNGVVITRPNTDGSTWLSRSTWYDNMTTAFIASKALLTNVQICQWINAPRNEMKNWVPDLRAAGIGLGMTDLTQNDKGFNYRNDIPGYSATPPGNIQHCQDSNGLTIIMGNVSKPAMEGTVSSRNQFEGTIQNQATVYPVYPGVGISRQAVHDFAVNIVGVTHLLWTHNTGVQPLTGDRDSRAPATADPYTAYPGYGGVGFNVITDQWINDAGSTIATVETRPTGW